MIPYFAKYIFKLEEEGNKTLLLHLPALFVETTFFGSAQCLRCCLVVAIAQGSVAETAIS
jgi:hypothetical protein